MIVDSELSGNDCVIPFETFDKYNYNQIIIKVSKGEDCEYLNIKDYSDKFKVSQKIFSSFEGGKIQYLDSKIFKPPGKIKAQINFHPHENILSEFSNHILNFSVLKLNQTIVLKKEKVYTFKILELWSEEDSELTETLVSVSKDVLFDFDVVLKRLSFNGDVSIL